MGTSTHQKILILLQQLADELAFLSLWQTDKPSEQALTSSQPFCCDTLRFEQWLQFIFIERISIMISLKSPLPTRISLCPMAEESFKHLGKKASILINIIADIDQRLSGKRAQTLFVNS